MFIEGKIYNKSLGDQRQNHFYISSQNQEIEPCSVETVALHYFLKDRGFNEGNFFVKLFYSQNLFINVYFYLFRYSCRRHNLAYNFWLNLL